GVKNVAPALENPTGHARNQAGLVGTVKQSGERGRVGHGEDGRMKRRRSGDDEGGAVDLFYARRAPPPAQASLSRRPRRWSRVDAPAESGHRSRSYNLL